MNKFNKVKNLAFEYGAEDFGVSNLKNKKYYVIYNNKKIHFGHPDYEDWHDHQDKERRERYLKRASKIKDKNGNYTYKNKSKPNFWAYHLLW